MEPFRHLLDLTVLLVVGLGPVPLGLAVLPGTRERRRGAASAWLVLLTVWCALELAVVLVLGIVGQYRLPVILTAEVVLAVGGLRLLRKRANAPVPWIRERFRIRDPLTREEAIVAASLALVGLVFLGRLAARPIIDFDSLWYHLPNMVVWYQTGTFAMMESTGRPVFEQVLRYPYGWEALSSLFLFPFREDFAVALPKLVAWAILGLSVHRLARRLGAMRLHALAAAALVLTVPFVLFDLDTLRIDIPFAAFFVAAVCFALLYAADRSPVEGLAGLVMLGLLGGTKMTGPIYAGLIVLVFLIAARTQRAGAGGERAGRAEPPRGGLLAAAVFLALLNGGFWYLRNWIEVGNPLGHVRLGLGGLELLPGEITIEMIQRTSLARLFDPTDVSHWKMLALQAGARLQLPFLVLAGLTVLSPAALPDAGRRGTRGLLVALLALVVATAWLYWAHTGTAAQGFSSRTVTPFLGQGFRYGFGLIGLLGVAAAVSATRFRVGARLTVATVLVCALTGLVSSTLSEAIKAAAFAGRDVEWASALADRLGTAPGAALGALAGAVRGQLSDVVLPTAVWAIGVAGVAVGVAARGRRGSGRGRVRAAGGRTIAVAVVVLAIASSGVTRELRDRRRAELYGGVPGYLSANVAPGETVGFVFSVYSYLFYGKNLDCRVAYVPATSDERSDWLATLRARGVSVVGAGPNLGRNRSVAELSSSVVELEWLESADGPFERVLGDDINRTPLLYRWDPGR